ncbi:unnamed protein product [Prorocentrum cordatum]|uniref:SnoaL-like domain-containing protein n=1 Tax=Prorocentrum cordatum TaxID=2364126 RepID=A0ABN9Q864_9DINO|nr:unnamed protein product [Polarella glacialis]
MEASLEAYLAAFLTDDHKGMLSFMADEVSFSDPLSGNIDSKANLTKHLAQAGGVIGEITQRVEDLAVQGNVAFLRWLHEGTNQVTGRRYSFSGVTFLRFKGSFVIEHRDFFDPKTLVSQFVEAKKHRSRANL